MITDQMIDQAYSELHGSCGGHRNDYLGLLYLEREFGLPRDLAVTQCAFGGNDYGVDGFHYDRERKNLYLFQFKNTVDHMQFKASFQRLIGDGVRRIFGAQNQDKHQNALLSQLKSVIFENESAVDRVFIHFVNTGDPEKADASSVLGSLREELENKKYLIEQRFPREPEHAVTLSIEFRSTATRRRAAIAPLRHAHSYRLTLDRHIARSGPSGEVMTIGFVRLKELLDMYSDMGQRFFDRNIRAPLDAKAPVNHAVDRALRALVLQDGAEPWRFAFHHNGVTLFAEALHEVDGHWRVTEPRLLNGAQTVATAHRFVTSNSDNGKFQENRHRLDNLEVLCRIITCNGAPDAREDFVRGVTVSNNRQNPVEAWNLRANDLIQLEIADWLKNELGLYYERQENAFQNLSDEDLADQEISGSKAIELKKLAQTLCAADGELDRMARMTEVFEDDKTYEKVFNARRLEANPKRLMLCYKVQFRLNKAVNDILAAGENKYFYARRARNLIWALLCQGMLNDKRLESRAEEFGTTLIAEAQFTDWLSSLATTRCRPLLADLASEKANAGKLDEQRFDFLRSNRSYKTCMDNAYKRWKWSQMKLVG